MGINQSIRMLKEWIYFTVIFQELDNRLIKSGERLVSFIFARIVYGTTIEYISTTIAGRIVKLLSILVQQKDLAAAS